MLYSYRDILSKLAEAPQWYDEYGVPRFCEFHPDELANIYAVKAALLRISCQCCGREFLVANSIDRFSEWRLTNNPSKPNASFVGSLGWGDPPCYGSNGECNCSGATMSCDFLAIEQYWHREEFEWHRVQGMEKRL